MSGDSRPGASSDGPPRSRRALLRDLVRLGGGVAGLGLLASCRPIPNPAGPTRVYRVGVLSLGGGARQLLDFWDRLTELGYVEGVNLTKEQRGTDPGAPQAPLADLAVELAGLPVDVLVLAGGGGLQ